MSVHFSKKSDEWSTPQSKYDELNKEFNFTFDLACSIENKKTKNGFTISDNSLEKDWHKLTGSLWLNPPYSKCKEFAEKAFNESKKGAVIVMLIPSRTDTRWFHDYIYNKENVDIRFIKGRLKFGDSVNSAPFPSMVVIFKITKTI